MPIFEQFENFELECLAVRLDQPRLMVDGNAEGRGVRVISTTQHDPVEAVQNRLRGTGDRCDGNSDRTAGRELPEVGPTESDLIIDQISRHADQGGAVWFGRGVHSKAPGHAWRRAVFRHHSPSGTNLRLGAFPASEMGWEGLGVESGEPTSWNDRLGPVVRHPA